MGATTRIMYVYITATTITTTTAVYHIAVLSCHQTTKMTRKFNILLNFSGKQLGVNAKMCEHLDYCR